MNNKDNIYFQLVDELGTSIDKEYFETTSILIDRIKFLLENFTDNRGEIESNRLALSLITTVADLELKINKLQQLHREGNCE
ncbi:hypothetical protein CPPEL_00995 [Corynebacterium pseudopelargi]|uniref:Uncharacterized protein n=2 Tax=Corynebacterium TaxID=1716 RepID=A0A3G6IS98_9CORY|nr:hypothetical protein CPPEL_00995 [Corynebacterium pseudopelargi]QAU51513.1 hypothetical protein CPELA_01060 [Corynebacterium pelargi]GGG79691.1 hypothetical protein GCM10007338_17550 [Corynebacterium pelargi]